MADGAVLGWLGNAPEMALMCDATKRKELDWSCFFFFFFILFDLVDGLLFLFLFARKEAVLLVLYRRRLLFCFWRTT